MVIILLIIINKTVPIDDFKAFSVVNNGRGIRREFLYEVGNFTNGIASNNTANNNNIKSISSLNSSNSQLINIQPLLNNSISSSNHHHS